MRTYDVTYLVGTRVIHRTKIKAHTKSDAMKMARLVTLPTVEQYDKILVRVIKNKGDK